MTKKNDIIPIDEKLSEAASDDLLPRLACSHDLTTQKKLDPALLLPVVIPDNKVIDPLAQYMREISRYKLLSLEQEKALTKALYETGDIEIARKLVVHNLRLVVKISMDYRKAHQNIMDLIQEGNIGLMKAVSKYNPSKGAKLSYYASWWIRSYILKFILDNFRLVKIGTTNEQKKLFFNLMKEKERLVNMGFEPDIKLLAENLGVSEKSVVLMEQRLGPTGGEVSTEAAVGEGSIVLGETLVDPTASPEDQLAAAQEISLMQAHLHDFVQGLKERDQDIFKKRLLLETPESLQSIADQYGVSRERIRQVEQRLINHLKVYMSDFLR